MLSQEKVIENKPIGNPLYGLYKLVLRGEIAEIALPGQFAHIQVAAGLQAGLSRDPLLRRPISIAGIDRPRKEITLYYRVAGRGTKLLTSVKSGESLSVLGPLGNGFTIPTQGELLLLAGGIGIFPLLSVIQAAEKVPSLKVTLLWGGQNKEFLESAGLEDLRQTGIHCRLATLDGTLGQKGLITDLLLNYLTSGAPGEKSVNGEKSVTGQNSAFRENLFAAACGPKVMLKAVTRICEQEGVPIEVSLEERMGCGVGACLGCACTVKDSSGQLKRKRICLEGPIIDGREVVWDG